MLVFIRGIETNILKLQTKSDFFLTIKIKILLITHTFLNYQIKNYYIIINCVPNTLQANSQILPLDILDLLFL